MVNRYLLVLARAIDYRVGLTDDDVPEVPVLKKKEAWLAFFIKLTIIIINFITCATVIANILHHW